MPQRRLVEAPNWFRLEAYDVGKPSRYDPTWWHRALSIRDDWQSDFEWRCGNQAARLKTDADRDHYWKAFLEHANLVQSETLPRHMLPEWVYPLPTHLYPIEELPAAALQNRRKSRAIAKWELDVSGKKVLLVDLSAPDTTLSEGFRAWLSIARQENPLPITRRGPKTLNVKITKHHFKTWHDYRVLACFDLDYFTRIYEMKPLSHERLFDTLNPGSAGTPKNWGAAARKALKKALRCVELLAHQIKGRAK